ncbi:MAG: ThiF family adenylyltransferase, partial [Planctomycetota bacterium]|nr:ThiF family adenylyltransferase [Planctomycetota bacterium]
RNGLPKAIAAAAKLRSINSEVVIQERVADVNPDNIVELCRDIDLILDGTDNFETRFLLNDASAKFQIPWIYGGCVGAEGQSLTIIPGTTPCLRCILPDAPAPGTTPSCDTAGILAPIVNIVASFQSMEAIKILSGHPEQISRTWNVWDLWDDRFRQIRLDQIEPKDRCETCQGRSFPWLHGERGNRSAILCGRNSVQVSAPPGTRVNLTEFANRFAGLGHVEANPFLVRLTVGDYKLTLFGDGRAIISGTSEESVAKSLYAKYVGA